MTDPFELGLTLLVAAIRQFVSGVHLLGGRHFGFGHFHRAGRGFAFGGRLLEVGLAAILCLGLAAMSNLAVADWAEKRGSSPELSRIAGILTFMVVLGALGFGFARLL